MNRIGLIFVLLGLAGCGGDSGTDSAGLPTGGDTLVQGAVAITCADIYQDAAYDECQPKAASLLEEASDLLLPKAAYAATVEPKVYEGGIISRSPDENGEVKLATVCTYVENTTEELFVGSGDVWIDEAGNGPIKMGYYPTIMIQTGETIKICSGSMWGDMPLGNRTLTMTIYGPDPIEVKDVAILRFTVIE